MYRIKQSNSSKEIKADRTDEGNEETEMCSSKKKKKKEKRHMHRFVEESIEKQWPEEPGDINSLKEVRYSKNKSKSYSPKEIKADLSLTEEENEDREFCSYKKKKKKTKKHRPLEESSEDQWSEKPSVINSPDEVVVHRKKKRKSYKEITADPSEEDNEETELCSSIKKKEKRHRYIEENSEEERPEEPNDINSLKEVPYSKKKSKPYKIKSDLAEEENDETDVCSSKKKKKEKWHRYIEENSEEDWPEEPNDIDSLKEVSYSKKKSKPYMEIKSDLAEEKNDETDVCSSKKKKKKKKKKEKRHGYIEENIEQLPEEPNDINSLKEVAYSEKKSKPYKEIKADLTEEENKETEFCSPKKKRKKEKKHRQKSVEENSGKEMSEKLNDNLTELGVNRKKKSKSHMEIEENQTVEENEIEFCSPNKKEKKPRPRLTEESSDESQFEKSSEIDSLNEMESGKKRKEKNNHSEEEQRGLSEINSKSSEKGKRNKKMGIGIDDNSPISLNDWVFDGSTEHVEGNNVRQLEDESKQNKCVSKKRKITKTHEKENDMEKLSDRHTDNLNGLIQCQTLNKHNKEVYGAEKLEDLDLYNKKKLEKDNPVESIKIQSNKQGISVENQSHNVEVSNESEDESYDDVNEFELSQLKNLQIEVNWDVPELHEVAQRLYHLTAKEAESLKERGLTYKSTIFTPPEDRIILENWERFKEEYLIETPSLFWHKKYGGKHLPKGQLCAFVQYLARGLNDRLLLRVYRRFRHLVCNIERTGS